MEGNIWLGNDAAREKEGNILSHALLAGRRLHCPSQGGCLHFSWCGPRSRRSTHHYPSSLCQRAWIQAMSLLFATGLIDRVANNSRMNA